jgi:spermidine/putrescine transport system permease protein
MKKDRLKYLLLFPIIAYSLLLIILPLIYIFFISFMKSDSYGGIIYTFNINNYIEIFNIVYIKVFLKSFIIATIATFICILISYPFTYFISRKKGYIKNVLITLVMIPFLTNSLIRTYGWIILLRKHGLINETLLSFELIKTPFNLMYNNLGIIIGMVYTLLPFMILPLYSSMEKINPKVIDAASDLGANKIKTFFKIIIPYTKTGLFNGIIMVFIPCLGYFFISDLLGGGRLMILGNLIKNQFLTARNWPFGAAISIAMLIVSYILVKIYKRLGGNMDDLGGM